LLLNVTCRETVVTRKAKSTYSQLPTELLMSRSSHHVSTHLDGTITIHKDDSPLTSCNALPISPAIITWTLDASCNAALDC
jgi:hypothetical protein